MGGGCGATGYRAGGTSRFPALGASKHPTWQGPDILGDRLRLSPEAFPALRDGYGLVAWLGVVARDASLPRPLSHVCLPGCSGHVLFSSHALLHLGTETYILQHVGSSLNRLKRILEQRVTQSLGPG